MNSIMINKIDDSVVSQLDDDKLKNIGLAYDDIKAFKNMFQETCNTTTNSATTYREEYLKQKLKRSYAEKKLP